MGPQGPKGDDGASIAYSARGDGAFANGEVVVASVYVPPGSYVINAKMSLENGDLGGVAFVTCRLVLAGTNQIDASSVARLDELPSIADSEDVALQGVASNFAGGTIAAKCHERADSSSDSDEVWAHNSKLTVLKVSTIDQQ